MGLRENLKRLCKEKDITISALEQELGYGNGALKKSDNIKLDRLVELAKYFGITIDELVAEEENKKVYRVSPADMAKEMLENIYASKPVIEKKDYSLGIDKEGLSILMEQTTNLPLSTINKLNKLDKKEIDSIINIVDTIYDVKLGQSHDFSEIEQDFL